MHAAHLRALYKVLVISTVLPGLLAGGIRVMPSVNTNFHFKTCWPGTAFTALIFATTAWFILSPIVVLSSCDF